MFGYGRIRNIPNQLALNNLQVFFTATHTKF
jgi:hypothetical protein